MKGYATQTRIKHEILKRYIDTWGGIIASGISGSYWQFRRSNRSHLFKARFVYVDCFSYKGFYISDEDETKHPGSPLIGVQAMEKFQNHTPTVHGFMPEVNVILTENDPVHYADLRLAVNAMDTSLSVTEHPDLKRLPSNTIALLNADYRTYLDDILDFTGQDYTWALYFLDPFGAEGIGLTSVSRIISQHQTDVIIYFPYYDLQKKLGSLIKIEKGKEDHPHRRHLEYFDKMFGSSRWRRHALKILLDDSIPEDERNKIAMEALVELYERTLQIEDSDLAVKKIPLLFQDMERVIYYLFLTTHDGTGALAMNKILDKADIEQYDYRLQSRQVKSEQLDMFAQDFMRKQDPARPKVREVDEADLGNQIYEAFQGEKPVYRELLRRMANTPYYPEDIKKAVKWLASRSPALVDFPGKRITNDTELSFR